MIDFKMGIVFDFVCDVLFIEFGIVILFKQYCFFGEIFQQVFV